MKAILVTGIAVVLMMGCAAVAQDLGAVAGMAVPSGGGYSMTTSMTSSSIPSSPIPSSPIPKTTIATTPIPSSPIPKTPIPTTPIAATKIPSTPVPGSPIPRSPIPAFSLAGSYSNTSSYYNTGIFATGVGTQNAPQATPYGVQY